MARTVIDMLKERGEELAGRVSAELMQNEHFLQAMQAALQGKERLERAAGQAVKAMNVPTRTELRKMQTKVEHLEAEVAALKAKAAAKPARRPPARKPRKAAAKPTPSGS